MHYPSAPCSPRSAQAEFGREFILVKRVLPLRLRERRENASDRSPLGDAQPGLSEPRDAPDDDNRDNERRRKQELVSNCRRGEHRTSAAGSGVVPLLNEKKRGSSADVVEEALGQGLESLTSEYRRAAARDG